ncbi:unnamed protein product [Ceutorhynchus assimilis]|uniref:HIT-type domain-containing protein n=1 Tax=Ceutorhynchus assimilis TaxID=467358 RepID=A0A9P0DH56_9CUCU|nr:unnamed protein product [Ceutorhynchus assimilis]
MPLKGAPRGSNRIKDNEKRRVIDDSQRKRRQRKFMELLESDNYHEDPHADLVMSKKVPKFDNSLEQRTSRNKKKERTVDYYQFKYRKNFQQLVEDNRAEAELRNCPSYMDVQCKESQLPQRRFCAVCGFLGPYSCLSCGTRYCSLKCMGTHMDTRCLKWAS